MSEDEKKVMEFLEYEEEVEFRREWDKLGEAEKSFFVSEVEKETK